MEKILGSPPKVFFHGHFLSGLDYFTAERDSRGPSRDSRGSRPLTNSIPVRGIQGGGEHPANATKHGEASSPGPAARSRRRVKRPCASPIQQDRVPAGGCPSRVEVKVMRYNDFRATPFLSFHARSGALALVGLLSPAAFAAEAAAVAGGRTPLDQPGMRPLYRSGPPAVEWNGDSGSFHVEWVREPDHGVSGRSRSRCSFSRRIRSPQIFAPGI